MKRNLIIILAIAAIVAAAVFYFGQKEVVFSKETSLYKAVPLTAPVFVESVSLKALPLDNPIIGELSGITAFYHEIDRVKKIRKTIKTEEGIQDNLNSRPVILAFDFVGKNVLYPVIIFSLKSSKEISGLKTLLEKLTGVPQASFITRRYNGKKITEVPDSEEKSKLQFCIAGNLVIISNEAILVEKCIRQLSAPGIAANKYFNMVNKTVTPQSEVSWYINHKHFPELWANFLNDKNNKVKNELGETKKINLKRDALKLKDYASWSELDFTAHDNRITLQGITTADDSLNHFLSIFNGQTPVTCHAARILPRQTSFYVDISFSDKNLFFKKLENYYVHSDSYYNREEQFKKIDDSFVCDSRDVLRSLVKDRITAAITSVSTNNKTESLLILTTGEDDEKRALFEGIIKSYAKHKKTDFNKLISSYGTDKRKYRIYNFPYPSFPEIWLGKIWDVTNANYATFHNNILIFASSKQGLKNYLNDIDKDIVLNTNEDYANFDSETGNKSNLCIYANIDKVYGLNGKLFNTGTAKALKNNEKILKRFDNLSWQMTCEDNIFFNSIVLGCQPQNTPGKKIKTERVKNAQSSWQKTLGATVAEKPQIVKNHYNKNSNEIIVQDNKNMLHLIAADGNPVWEKPILIKGKIMGKIHQIDYYNNGKLQYLFNTKEKIYLIDRRGRMTANFPLILKSPATNGVNVFDYDNNGNFRYFVACENKKVYAYSREGKIVSGWKFGQTAGIVKNPIHHFRVAGKDYIVFLDETKVYIQNRRGQTRIKVMENLNPSSNDVTLSTNGVPKIIVTDKEGTVYYLFFDGKFDKKETANFSVNHKFATADINGDQKPEFIFAEGKRLTVYNESGKKLFSKKLKEPIDGNIGIYTLSASKKLIGATSRQGNKIHLYEPSGKECRSFPLEGDTDFSIGRLKNGGGLNLIVGSKDRLISYSLE